MDFEDLLGGGGDVDGAEEVGDLFMFGGNEQSASEELKDQKDSVIFLIDCHESMFKQNPHNGHSEPDCESTSSIDSVLRAALSFMKTKIITNDNDKIGIVLYGTKVTDNSLNLSNIAVMQKLDQSDATSIKNFQDKISVFESEFGFAPKSKKSPLFEALWACHQEFKSVEKQSYSKRIFLFTDDDCPGNAEE